jgi:hypothetical protein
MQSTTERRRGLPNANRSSTKSIRMDSVDG